MRSTDSNCLSMVAHVFHYEKWMHRLFEKNRLPELGFRIELKTCHRSNTFGSRFKIGEIHPAVGEHLKNLDNEGASDNKKIREIQYSITSGRPQTDRFERGSGVPQVSGQIRFSFYSHISIVAERIYCVQCFQLQASRQVMRVIWQIIVMSERDREKNGSDQNFTLFVRKWYEQNKIDISWSSIHWNWFEIEGRIKRIIWNEKSLYIRSAEKIDFPQLSLSSPTFPIFFLPFLFHLQLRW